MHEDDDPDFPAELADLPPAQLEVLLEAADELDELDDDDRAIADEVIAIMAKAQTQDDLGRIDELAKHHGDVVELAIDLIRKVEAAGMTVSRLAIPAGGN